MNLEDIMSKNVVSVEMDDTLKTVKVIFDHSRFHHLLVVQSGQLYGVISDRDLLKVLSPNIGTPAETSKDLFSLNKKVHQIMTRQPVTLKKDASIGDALDIFINYNMSCIPIINDANLPIGIISWRDIMRVFSSHHEKNDV